MGTRAMPSHVPTLPDASLEASERRGRLRGMEQTLSQRLRGG